MAQSALEAAQGACVKIGANKIAALNGTDKTSVALNDRIDICKRHLLRMHPWNFAIKRTVLEPTWVTISNAADNGSGLIRLTATTHGRSTGDRITVRNVSGVPANGQWYVTVIDANTLDLIDSTFSGTYAAAADELTLAAKHQYDYSIALPADNLRILRVNESCPYDWRIEAGRIVTSNDEIELKYIYDVTDYTTMSIDFYETLQWYLALDVCYLITQSSQLKEMLQDNFRRALAKARFDDATEDPAEQIQADDWINSRQVGEDDWFAVGRY